MKIKIPFFDSFFVRRGKSLLFVFITLSISLSVKWAAAQTVPAALTVVASPGTLCAGTSTTLTASGCPASGAIRWSTTQTGSVIAVAPKQTTSYTAVCEVTSTTVVSTTVTSTTASSTTAIVTTVTATTATATVKVIPPLAATLDTIPPLCNGNKDGMIVIHGSGGAGTLQYQLDGGAFQKQNTFGSLRAGTYPFVIKDSVGCTLQLSVKLTQPQALSASIMITSTKCIGGVDGALTAVASGGAGTTGILFLTLLRHRLVARFET